MKHVVIVGGGFGGIRAARILARTPELFRVTLISDEDCFRYYPALYRSAAGHSKRESCIAVELLLHDCKNVTFKLSKAVKIDKKKQIITLESGESIDYDEAILALGVITSYFNIPGIEEYSHGLKTEEELDRLRQDIHEEFNDGIPDKNYVVVGGGPTGVEISASLSSYLKKIAKWHNAGNLPIRLMLIEAAPRIIPRMSEKVSRIVTARLQNLGINVVVNKKVESETAKGIKVDNHMVDSRMVIWTAGVINNPFFKENADQFSLAEKGGKVEVDKYMQAAKHLYVIGDNATTKYSGVAMTAINDAEYVAFRLIALVKRRRSTAYQQKEPVTVMPIGEKWALIQYKSLIVTGWLGSIIHSLNDLRIYAKIMTFSQAYLLWRSSKAYEEECDICARAQWTK